MELASRRKAKGPIRLSLRKVLQPLTVQSGTARFKGLKQCVVSSSDFMLTIFQGRSPGGSEGKASVYQCGRPGFNPWVGKSPWRRKWQPAPVLLPRKPHGQRSLVQATAHGVEKSQTQLSDFTFSFFQGESFPDFAVMELGLEQASGVWGPREQWSNGVQSGAGTGECWQGRSP